jgi:hypothetical protein
MMGGKTLVVTVREKWAVFPLPIGSIGADGWSIGGVLADLNAFGAKDMMMVAGMCTADGWMAGAMYANTPDNIGTFGWHIAGRFSVRENEDIDQTGRETLRRFDPVSIHPVVGLMYALNEYIMLNFYISYQDVTLRDTEHPVRAPEYGGLRSRRISTSAATHGTALF